MQIKELIGEVLTHIDTDEENNEIMLTTKSGRIIKIFHYQNCCEYVSIEDTDGNWHDLIGKVIIEATHDEFEKGEPEPEYPDYSWTRTSLKFVVDDATVISKWIGSSNGYYSETVDIQEITKDRK